MSVERRGVRSSLPYRQSALAMAIAVIIGMVIGAGLIGYELFKARENTEEMLQGVLDALEAPAVEAAYNLNRDTATSVVAALSRFSFVRHAAVYDNFGTILAERRRPTTAGAFDTLGNWIVDHGREYSRDLVSTDLGRSVGRLVIHADGRSAASGVVKTALLILGLGFVHNILLAAILAFAFFLTLTRPLMKVWRMVQGVNPAAWPHGRLVVPGTERPDEIGELALALNRFMEMARDRQRQAEREMHERVRAEAALRDRDARVRRLVESNIIGIVFWDFAGHITMANDAFLAIVGYSRDDLLSGRVGWRDITPEEYRSADCAIAAELRRNRTIKPFQKEYVRPDGSRVPVLIGAAVFEGSSDEGIAFVLDLTERKQADERQKLLVDELNHRVKNTLATVQALVAQTLRTAATPEDFRAALEGRLLALSQAHNLLNRSAWAGARLRDLVWDELAPFATGEADQFAVSGDDVCIAPNPTVTLGMAIHELATNAAKYGALSRPTGHIAVTWAVAGNGDQRRLRLEWREDGGPPVREPDRKGFGRYLVEQGVARQLGSVHLDFLPDGVCCAMDLPWDRVRGEDDRCRT